ncbi:MAG TPA: hypothetical protein DIW77_12260, partial [Chromatiaceae bacterium]|nr:hypothetical protein [Chromatiaceae bacterium]
LSNFRSYASAALVDIGYAGSAQGVLRRLVGQPLKGFYAITSERIENLKTAGLICEGWLADGVPMADHWLFEHVQAWEMFFSASHGSALDIQPNVDGIFCWTLDDNLFDPSVRRTLAAIHHGAVDCVQDFVERHQDDFLSLRFNAQHCSTPLHQFFTAPAAEDCIGLADAVFEDRFGGDVRKMAAICHPDALTLNALKQAIVWQEAAAVLSGASPNLIASVSSLPLPPNADASQITNAFIDEFNGTDILPSWCSDLYRQAFDSDGWLVPMADASHLRLVLPLTYLDDRAEASLRSIAAQHFSGLAVTILCFGNKDDQALLQMLGSIPAEVRAVASWSEVTHLMHSFAEPWVVLTDGYTMLNEEFSAEIIARIKARPRADIILVDDDWHRADDRLQQPHFKPEWSRELLLSTDYFGGVYTVRKALLDGLKSSCTTTSGWLWELALHVATKTDRIERIPRILAHRSMERYAAELGQAQNEMCRVMQHTFNKLGSNARIETPAWAIEHNRLVCQPRFPDQGPRVAIIIPTKNQHQLVKRCIDSIRTTTYQNYQIYLVDNESDDPGSLAYFESLATQGVQILRISNPADEFSYSYVNNRATEQTQGEEYLLFLNNDTEVIEPRWLSQMVGWQQLPAVGSVGARLLFPNNRVQHAGITHRLLYNVLPAPSLKCEPGDKGGYQDYLYLNRDSAAQTAACLLTPRSTFIHYGMFDEGLFAVAYNDCDYGFKLTQAGLHNVYCADAVLYHHEGYSRGIGQGNDKLSEEAAFVRKYASWSDPYYSPNLALGRTDFATQPVSTITTPIPRLKIALVTHNLEYEGAPLVLSDIGIGLHRFGIADVLVLSPKDGPLRAAYEAQGCQVLIHSNSNGVFRSNANGLESVASVAASYIEYDIDVVLANTVLCWWGIEAAAMARLPSLRIIHESEPPFTHLAEHGEACAQRGRRALALPYRVVFVADATREVFADLETNGNFAVYHNSYTANEAFNALSSVPRHQARKALDLPQDAVIGLLPGTVCERKSQIDLLHATKLLSTDTLERLLLIILGDRPSDYSTALHEHLARLESSQRNSILVLDHCPGAETYFRAADFMISTSRIEAFPRIVQEAMWFELAMVVAPVYGIKEQVQDEVSALFFPPGDAKSLAQQIERLAAEPELRHRLGVNARTTLDRFPSVDEMVWYYGRLTKEAWLSKP